MDKFTFFMIFGIIIAVAAIIFAGVYYMNDDGLKEYKLAPIPSEDGSIYFIKKVSNYKTTYTYAIQKNDRVYVKQVVSKCDDPEIRLFKSDSDENTLVIKTYSDIYEFYAPDYSIKVIK